MTTKNWEVLRLVDGLVSIRFRGIEKWILPPLSDAASMELERMLNHLNHLGDFGESDSEPEILFRENIWIPFTRVL